MTAMKPILIAACWLLGLALPALAQSDNTRPSDGAPTGDAASLAHKPQKVAPGIAYGYRTHYVDPIYPPLARRAKLEGDVVLNAIIDTRGKVTRLRVLSGHPLLAQSAIDAVRQWKYRPYLFEGKVVPVDTTITVQFHL
jgi:TonB family protein